MPITLGCPSCGKRFKARDESAGKRVKCPYCAVAVTVPTPEETALAAAPTMAMPPPPVSPPPPPPAPVTTARPSPLSDSIPVPAPRTSGVAPSHEPRNLAAPSAPVAPSAPAPVATPDDWGAEPPRPRESAIAPSPPPPEDFSPTTFPLSSTTADQAKKSVRPGAVKKTVVARSNSTSPDQLTGAAWRKARGGLLMVLFGLFFLALPGFVEFAKTVLPRAGVALPAGEGWVIPGYVNSNYPGAIKMKKEEQIDVLAYGVPVIIAGLALSLGRVTCGAAPRSSGAKGLFALSGILTLVGLASLATAAFCKKLLFNQTYEQASLLFLITGSLAEFWFLTGLACSGVSLKRPRTARAVGLVGFFFALAAFVPTLGWVIYKQEFRTGPVDDDWKMYEQAALMLGWLLLIGVYGQAVGSVRSAIRDFLQTVEE